jgi:hypothetical protein
MGFGSLEAALTTTADVALHCWWTWTRAGAGIINGGLSGAAQKSTKQSGRNVSKCINSNVCKDSYNEAIENGYILHLKLLLLLRLWLLLCGKLLNTFLYLRRL